MTKPLMLSSLIICALRAQTAQPAQASPSTPRAHLMATFLANPLSLKLSDSSCRIIATHRLLKEAPERNARIKVGLDPVHVTAPSGDTLYVLQIGDKRTRVSAFGLVTGAAMGDADVNIAAEFLAINKDGDLLLAYGGRNSITRMKDRIVGGLTVLDAATLQVKFSQSFAERPAMVSYLRNLDRLMVMDNTGSTLWFVDPHGGPAAPLQLGGMARGAILSADGKRLLTLVRNVNKSGKKTVEGGVLNQFDIATGRLLHGSENLGGAVRLIQLGGVDQYWVQMKDRMQRVTPEGDPGKAVITFADLGEDLGRPSEGLPGPSIGFGNRIAVEVLHRDGTLAHELAIVDPEEGRVDSLTPIGRPGVRAGKAAKRWAIALALTVAIPNEVFLPGGSSQASSMAVSPDEKSVYVLDAESDDVTVVKSDGTAEVMPIKASIGARLWRPAQAPFIYHLTNSAIAVIDPATNEIALQIDIEKGASAALLSDLNEIAICNQTVCEIWDAITATSIRSLDRSRLKEYLSHADEPADDENPGAAPQAPATCEMALKGSQRSR